MSSPRKLHHFVDGEWLPYQHGAVYQRYDNKLIAGVPSGDARYAISLLSLLSGPFYLLYVLHTPRGEAEPGRYQSPLTPKEDVVDWMTSISAFLAADGRFDLWIHDPAAGATLVWDRHDLLHAYGAVDRFAACLDSLGFVEGEPRIPSPHDHYFRQEFDGVARDIMQSRDWYRTPLRDEDMQ